MTLTSYCSIFRIIFVHIVYFIGIILSDPIISVKSASGSSQIHFGIKDIENGEIFRWMGNMFQEPLMLQKYEALIDLYMKDPLKPLEKLYKRPPIKHVMMIYGVDLPTEVGYTYRIPDNPIPASSSNGGTTASSGTVFEREFTIYFKLFKTLL